MMDCTISSNADTEMLVNLLVYHCFWLAWLLLPGLP